MWMAPELFKEGTTKSRTSDVYAFGMTIIEVKHKVKIGSHRSNILKYTDTYWYTTSFEWAFQK